MPEIGRPRVSGVARDLGHHVERDRLDRRAAIAAVACPCRRWSGIGAKVSRSTEVIELMVLISDTASAPPRLAARAG